MKTILYNPIFINPQAYYVFPQLYDIEKGDSFIEPAIYSGYLLIEDLVSNTSSQVTDTKEVDFTQFAGKRIRISQYTNIGAVVLGEWLLPEGEPSGPSFHQSLVDAWFMSGLSNIDKPSSIRGVKGNEMQLKNFTFTPKSGFGEGSYEGALVFDGVDDYAYVDNFDTLIDGDEFTTIGYYEVIPQGNKLSYNLYARSSNANWSRIETPSITTPSYGKRSYTVNYTSNTSSYDILEGESFKMDKGYKVFPKRFFLNGWFDETNNYLFDTSKVAHYWVAIYKGKLTPEEIETEKERLNEEWLKRKTE